MRLVRRAAFSLVMVLTLATGCFASKETREGADRLEDALGTPSWAQSVDVDTSVSGLTDDVVETVVSLKTDATADEIATFVVDHPDRVEDAGLGAGFGDLRFVTVHGAVLTVPAADTTDETAVRAAVERWQRLLPQLGTKPTADLSRETGEASFVAQLGSGGADAVAELVGLLLVKSELTVPADAWSVSAEDGDLGMTLSSYTLPTAGEVRIWGDLVRALQLLPSEFRATELSLQRLEGRTVVDQMLLMPDGVTRENITPARYGDQLWPALRGQLRAVHAIHGPWSYLVQWAPVDVSSWTTILLSLLDDDGPIDNHDPASLWSAAAKEFVDGL